MVVRFVRTDVVADAGAIGIPRCGYMDVHDSAAATGRVSQAWSVPC